MYCNSTCTLYHYNGKGYSVSLFNCYWYDTASGTTGKDGMTASNSVRLIIPTHKPIECGLKDFFVKGKGASIDNTDEQSISKSIKALEKIHSVSSISEKLYGSPNMQHYEFNLR